MPLRPQVSHSTWEGFASRTSRCAAGRYASAMTPIETRNPARRWRAGISVPWPTGSSPGNQRTHSSLNRSNSAGSRSDQFAQTTLSSEVPASSSLAFRLRQALAGLLLDVAALDDAGVGVDRADRRDVDHARRRGPPGRARSDGRSRRSARACRPCPSATCRAATDARMGRILGRDAELAGRQVDTLRLEPAHERRPDAGRLERALDLAVVDAGLLEGEDVLDAGSRRRRSRRPR